MFVHLKREFHAKYIFCVMRCQQTCFHYGPLIGSNQEEKCFVLQIKLQMTRVNKNTLMNAF